MKPTVTISVITYRRLGKWIKLMKNLEKVRQNCPDEIKLKFLFIEDSKTPKWYKNLKYVITNIIRSPEVYYVDGRDNLGSSRNFAFEYFKHQTTWIGFIDDDDYYDEKVLQKCLFGFIKEGSLAPDVINFGMSGNFKIGQHNYVGYPEHKNRLRKFDDPKYMACVPSSASFYRMSTWHKLGLKYRDGFFEDTSTNMLFTYLAPVALHIGINLMFRNRAKNSIVNGLSKYSYNEMNEIILFHVRNLYEGVDHNIVRYNYLYNIFKYNFGSYVKSHGFTHNVDKIFSNIETNKLYKNE